VSEKSAIVELLGALLPVFSERKTRWYVFGAQAVMIWGRPRMSADVDVTAEIPPEEVLAFVRTMENAGFSIRVGQVEDFVLRTRVLPFLHDSSGIPLDLVLAGPGLEEEFMARCQPQRIGSLSVPVISPEDLIVTKILAGRPKDLDDVRGILDERRNLLDLAQVRSTLELLERALSRSDLVRELETELERQGRKN